MKTRRLQLSVALMVIGMVSSSAFSEDMDPQSREFDLRPSLNGALIAELAEDQLDATTDPLVRQQRAIALMMPTMAKEGGDGGGDSSD